MTQTEPLMPPKKERYTPITEIRMLLEEEDYTGIIWLTDIYKCIAARAGLDPDGMTFNPKKLVVSQRIRETIYAHWWDTGFTKEDMDNQYKKNGPRFEHPHLADNEISILPGFFIGKDREPIELGLYQRAKI